MTTHGWLSPTRAILPPSSRSGDRVMWNGPSTVDWVAPAAPRSVIVSTSIEIPSTSDSRMNSWRTSVPFWPVAVRNSIACSHSAMLGSTSRTAACRCRTRLSRTVRSRSSGVPAKLSTTASAAPSSVKSVAIPRGYFVRPAGVTLGRKSHQVPELVRVDHRPDRDHLPVEDVEGHDAEQVAVAIVGDHPGLAVDLRRVDVGGPPRGLPGQAAPEPGDLVPAVERGAGR